MYRATASCHVGSGLPTASASLRLSRAQYIGRLAFNLTSFTDGIEDLVHALVRALGPRVKTGCAVRRVRPRNESDTDGWVVDLEDGRTFEADAVVLAAAGSSRPEASAAVRAVADDLSCLVHRPVQPCYVAAPEGSTVPSIMTAVAGARRLAGRVVVAPYLLVPGAFLERLRG